MKCRYQKSSSLQQQNLEYTFLNIRFLPKQSNSCSWPFVLHKVFGLCPSSGILKKRTERFGNWICIRPRVRGSCTMGKVGKPSNSENSKVPHIVFWGSDTVSWWVGSSHGSNYKVYHLLGCDVLKSGGSLPTLRRNWYHLQGRNVSQAIIISCFLGILFNLEVGGSTFLRNVGKLLPEFTA
jgi:hypothetical protein